MSDAQKIKAQNLGGIDARAAAAGMSGSTGYHNSANQMANNVDEQTMQGMNNLRFQSYDRGVQNNMALAGMMDRNQQFGVANTGAMQQNAMNQFNPAMAGLNATGMYGQIIGGLRCLVSLQAKLLFKPISGSSSGFSNSVNYGMNQSGGYTGAITTARVRVRVLRTVAAGTQAPRLRGTIRVSRQQKAQQDCSSVRP